MKRLALLLLCAVSASAQIAAHVDIPLKVLAHPVATAKAFPAANRWMLLADIVLQDANAIDYVTTRRGAFPGTRGCELNPLFVSAPCQINVPRFAGVKIGTAAFGLAQWLPIWTHRTWAGAGYKRLITITDVGLSAALIGADINNIRQLTK